jgi:transcriptional regulator with XRE-family HTH domain
MRVVISKNLGRRLRSLRKEKKETLREVAASASMDPAILSKIERGQRLPTTEQLKALARHLEDKEEGLQAERIAIEFCSRYKDSPYINEAIQIIQKMTTYNNFEHQGANSQ